MLCRYVDVGSGDVVYDGSHIIVKIRDGCYEHSTTANSSYRHLIQKLSDLPALSFPAILIVSVRDGCVASKAPNGKIHRREARWCTPHERACPGIWKELMCSFSCM
jgi:hypothetical protein